VKKIPAAKYTRDAPTYIREAAERVRPYLSDKQIEKKLQPVLDDVDARYFDGARLKSETDAKETYGNVLPQAPSPQDCGNGTWAALAASSTVCPGGQAKVVSSSGSPIAYPVMPASSAAMAMAWAHPAPLDDDHPCPTRLRQHRLLRTQTRSPRLLGGPPGSASR
jgi:hypothetical protein